MTEQPFQGQVARAVVDPVRGSEQAGERPVLIISNEAINQSLTIVTALPVTTRRPGRRIYSTEVLLPAGTAGLPSESIVMAHQIRTIAKERLLHTYGWLDDINLREEVHDALRIHLDMDWLSR